MLSPYNFLFPSSQWGMGACSGPKWPPMAPPEHPEKAHFFKKTQNSAKYIWNNGQAIAPLLPKSSTGVRHCSVAGERPKLIAADTATTTTSHKNGFPGKSWFPLQILHTNFDRIWDNMELPNKGLDSVISKLNQAVLYERTAVQIGERSLPQCSAQILQRRPPSIKNGFSIKSEF